MKKPIAPVVPKAAVVSVKKSGGKPTAIDKKATKGGKVFTCTPDLDMVAAQVAQVICNSTSLSQELGHLVREAAVLIAKNPDHLDGFVESVKDTCKGINALTDGSLKVYCANIRGVIRAMLDGYVPKQGATLRQMYDDAPKGKGRQAVKTGARHDTDKPEASDDADDADDVGTAPAAAATVSKDDARKAAITLLFGHYDDQLDAAVSWSAQNELRFLNLIEFQIKDAAKPVGEVKAPRARKAA